MGATTRELENWMRFVRNETHVLAQNPQLMFQQAANQPEQSPQARAARERQQSGREKRPWLRWLNRPRSASAGVMVLTGHEGRLKDAAFSPDGTRIVSVADDMTVRLWDASNGKLIATMLGHKGMMMWSSRFSPDGTRIVSSGWGPQSGDTTVRLWDADTGEPIAVLIEPNLARESLVSFSPDGRHVLTHAQGTLKLWNAATGALFSRLTGHTRDITCCIYSADRDLIFSASEDGTARLWNLRLGTEPLVLSHGVSVGAAAFDRNGLRVVTGADDGSVRMWDTVSGDLLTTFPGHPVSPTIPLKTSVTRCQFSADGARIVTAAADQSMRVWDVEAATQLAVFRILEYKTVDDCWFVGDGSRLVSISTDAITVWDIENRQEMWRVSHGDATAWSVSPDGGRILCGWSTGAATVLDLDTGKEIRSLPGHSSPVSSCVYSGDGVHVLTAGDTTLRLWDALSDEGSDQSEQLEAGVVWHFAFSPDASLLGFFKGNDIRLCDSRSGRTIKNLECRSQVRHFAFAPDGRHLVAATKDLQLWDIRNDEPRSYSEEPEKLSFLEEEGRTTRFCAYSPDGSRVFSAGTRGVNVWDSQTLRHIGRSHVSRAPIASCCFSPDGKLFATVSISNEGQPYWRLDLWNAGTLEHVRNLSSTLFDVRAVVFSPDGSTLVSAGGKHLQNVEWNGERNALVWDSHCELRLWDTAEMTELLNLSDRSGAVHDCSYSPDGAYLLTGGFAGELTVYEAARGKKLETAKAHSGTVSARFLADGRHVISADQEVVRIWRLQPFRPVCSWFGKLSGTFAVTPDHRIAVNTNPITVMLFDLQNVDR